MFFQFAIQQHAEITIINTYGITLSPNDAILSVITLHFNKAVPCSIQVCCKLDMLSKVDKSSTGHLLFCEECGIRCFAWAQNVSSRWTKLQLWRAADGRNTQAGDIGSVAFSIAIFEMLQWKQHLPILIRLDSFTFHQGEVQPLLTRFEHLFHENLTSC